MSASMITVGEFCEGLECTPVELMEVLNDRHRLELSRHEAKMARCAGRPDNVALPLRDEGEDFGRIEARIPRTLFFNLLQRQNFGWEGLTSDEGMRDVLRDNPQCRVETVSGRTTVGWRGAGRRVIKRYDLTKSQTPNPKLQGD